MADTQSAAVCSVAELAYRNGPPNRRGKADAPLAPHACVVGLVIKAHVGQRAAPTVFGAASQTDRRIQIRQSVTNQFRLLEPEGEESGKRETKNKIKMVHRGILRLEENTGSSSLARRYWEHVSTRVPFPETRPLYNVI